MKKVFIVQGLGWGDSESEFYNVGAFSTLAKAKAHVKNLQNEWKQDNGDLVGCTLQIEDLELDA